MLQFQWCVCCLVIGIADFKKKKSDKILKNCTYSLFYFSLNILKGLKELVKQVKSLPAVNYNLLKYICR